MNYCIIAAKHLRIQQIFNIYRQICISKLTTRITLLGVNGIRSRLVGRFSANKVQSKRQIVIKKKNRFHPLSILLAAALLNSL